MPRTLPGMTRPVVYLLLAVSSCLVACEPTGDPIPKSRAVVLHATDVIPPSVESEFYESIVNVEADRLTIRIQPITLDQERADRVAREVSAEALTIRDMSCAGSSLWLYDRPGALGNRICFQGFAPLEKKDTYVDLSSIPRLWGAVGIGPRQPLAYWDITTGSYWPGVSAGVLADELTRIGSFLYGVDAPPPYSDADVGFVLTFPSWGPLTPFDVAPHRTKALHLFW